MQFDFQAFIGGPLNLQRKPTEDFSEESLEMPDYSEYDYDVEYKEEFTWSLDLPIAILLDKGLTALMNFPYTPPPEGTERARDIFRRYARKYDENSNLLIETDFELIESDDYKDLMWALEWLKNNFTALWT